MIRRARRVGAGLVFAMLGYVSLVVADRIGQWACTHAACGRVAGCPIDTCDGNARLNMLRIAVWVGPAVVFGVSAFLFAARQHSLGAWWVLLTLLMVAHTLLLMATLVL